MRQYSNTGKIANMKDLVEEMGFKVGCHVIRKDKVTAQILGFKDEYVLLDVNAGGMSGECRVDAQSFVNNEWTLFKPKTKPECLPEYWEHGPLQNPEIQQSCIRAKILLELRNSMGKCTSVVNPSCLKLMTKPKGVFAEEKIEKHALRLIPFTNAIFSREHGTENPNSSQIKVFTFQDEWDFYLVPSVQLPKEDKKGMIVPFWFVGATYDPDMANCELALAGLNSLADLIAFLDQNPAMELKSASRVEIVSLIGCRLDDGELWVPQVQTIGDSKLMLLSKWDRGLTKFLTGKCLDWNKDKKNLNSTSAGAYLDHLCKLRKAASLKAVQDAHANESDDEVPGPSSKRARRTAVRVTADMAHFSPMVTIELPAAGGVEAKPVKVAFGTSSRDLWMEVDQSNLLHVVLGMKEWEAEKGRGRKVKNSDLPEGPSPSKPQSSV
ncbi:unnamed protein product, partial [Durusdinium trenchii]